MEVAANLPPARADRDRIVQVLTNLVSNAHKYTPADGAIVVSAGKQDELVRIAVQDNGIGIPQDDIPKLFSRFFRVDSSLTREIGGTGLGLSIVKSIVELHGGTVTVDSAPGSGSTFSFTLPVAVPSEPERSVLLVDGEPSVDDLSDALGRVGYHVDVVDASHALTRSEEHRPDLIVVRLRLANRGCLEEVHSLAEAAERQHIPLLVVSQLEPKSTTQWPALDGALVVDRVQHALAESAESARRQVLVIEDDASIRRLLSTSLGQRGFEAIEAEDGETGLRLADERKPDLIVLDLRLPGIDGFTVLQRLKHSPATADTPVIAVTGDEGLLLGARARVLSLGASDFVEKPFQMDTLIDEIRALTGAKEDLYAHSRTGR